MDELNRRALAAAQSIRSATGFAHLSLPERQEIERHLGRLEAALRGETPATLGARASGYADPFAVPLATPNDLRAGTYPPRQTGAGVQPVQPKPMPPAPRQGGTEVIGERARRALDAVDFPAFVAELVQGTFQAIVDATAQQVREYAKLVADLSRSLDDFTRDNVTPNQARDWLAEKYPKDLTLVLPSPGERGEPRIVPRKNAADPPWLADHGLAGETLTEELTEGPLLDSARTALGEERMRSLATMVLLGVNRIVVDDGQLRAKLHFHARAREKMSAEVVADTGAQQLGIAGRQSGVRSAISTMVSTVDVNSQADVSIKTDLVGEVALRFRTETFDLNNFADGPAIALINRHALKREGQETLASPRSETSAGAVDRPDAAPPERASE